MRSHTSDAYLGLYAVGHVGAKSMQAILNMIISVFVCFGSCGCKKHAGNTSRDYSGLYADM